jgi:CheY-like chemotaxis protein
LVLVADDDPALRLLMSVRLRQWGYRVLVSADGEEALRALRANAVDVVLLDLQMPKVDGYGVLQEVGRNRSPQRASVIIVSGCSGGDAVMRGLTAGAEDYLPKPFATVELEARLRAVVARRASTRALLELQAAVVSPVPLSRPAVEVSAVHRPAAGSAAGGDFHAVVDGPDGTHVLVVGDVMGHGPSTAALASHLRTVFVNRARIDAGPDRLLDHLNRCVGAVGDDAESGAVSMATAVCVTLHPCTGSFSWALAGHLPPVLLPAGVPLGSDACGPPLGVLDDAAYPVSTARLRPGQGLLMFSDGLTEARGTRSAEGEQFGDVVLPTLLSGIALATPSQETDFLRESLDALLKGLLRAHDTFSGAVARDDLTVLACACTRSWADPA